MSEPEKSESKSPWASKTYWGAVLAVFVPLIIRLTGIEATDAEVQDVILNLSSLVGFGLIVWGRQSAKQAVDLKKTLPGSKADAQILLFALALPSTLALTGCSLWNTLFDANDDGEVTATEVADNAFVQWLFKTGVNIGLNYLQAEVPETADYIPTIKEGLGLVWGKATPEADASEVAAEVDAVLAANITDPAILSVARDSVAQGLTDVSLNEVQASASEQTASASHFALNVAAALKARNGQ